MRIISGQYKGRRIQAPKNLPVRPTTDMAKEALFNILNNTYYFDEVAVLDLFAGTGSISYEFASRGSEDITSVDADYNCIKFIKQTADDFAMPITPVKSDVYQYLQQEGKKWDIIFADPPYAFSAEEFGRIPALVFEHHLLQEDGIMVVEHDKHVDLSSFPNYVYSKTYGGNVFSFFEHPDGEEV